MKKLLTDAERLAQGERSGVMSKDSAQILNAMSLLGNRLKDNQRYEGSELRLFVKEMERLGVKIPDRLLDTLPAAELRAFRTAFSARVAEATMPTSIPWTDAELQERYEQQKRMFNELNGEQR